MLFVLNNNPSVASDFIRQLRDSNIQKDRMRFRKNLERIGQILAYEVSKTLLYETKTIQTPLKQTTVDSVREQPVLITILRAGLPFYNGFASFFDEADSGFVGAYRNEDGNHMTIKLDYIATGNLSGKTVIIIDPMLATGRSIADAYKAMATHGTPAKVHVVSLVATPQGVKHLQEHIPVPLAIWTAALDEGLNEQNYIVPGLGDAGDLCFGEKQ